jgi:protein-disulfide isomerase
MAFGGSEKGMTVRGIIDALAGIAMLAASCVIIYVFVARRPPTTSRLPDVLPDTPLAIGTLPAKGNKDASVILMEFSEFECPFCARFADATHRKLVETYVDTGKVLLVFNHRPLANHQFAVDAGAAAECAGEKGRFWEMHDLLFANQPALDRPSILRYGDQLALDRERFAACLATDGRQRVEEAMSRADELGIVSTPYFLAGHRNEAGDLIPAQSIRGAKAFQEFEAVLNRLLADSK